MTFPVAVRVGPSRRFGRTLSPSMTHRVAVYIIPCRRLYGMSPGVDQKPEKL